MRYSIREGVFETNSSSMHSISMRGQSYIENPNYFSGRKIVPTFGEYGWGHEVLYSPEEKLSYVLTYVAHQTGEYDGDKLKKFKKRKKEIQNSDLLKKLESIFECEFDFSALQEDDLDISYPFGYIDHQSADLLDELWKDDAKPSIKDLVLDHKYKIIIDNDNH